MERCFLWWHNATSESTHKHVWKPLYNWYNLTNCVCFAYICTTKRLSSQHNSTEIENNFNFLPFLYGDRTLPIQRLFMRFNAMIPPKRFLHAISVSLKCMGESHTAQWNYRPSKRACTCERIVTAYSEKKKEKIMKVSYYQLAWRYTRTWRNTNALAWCMRFIEAARLCVLQRYHTPTHTTH